MGQFAIYRDKFFIIASKIYPKNQTSQFKEYKQNIDKRICSTELLINNNQSNNQTI